MAEETKFKIWQVVQSVIASLLVLVVANLGHTISQLNDNVIRHDVLIKQLDEFRKAGNRFTERDGTVLADKLEMMNENQIRMWKAIREHIEKGQHQGADYRMKRLEKHLKDTHSKDN